MAQLVARLVRNEKVGGSNPPSSTAAFGLLLRGGPARVSPCSSRRRPQAGDQARRFGEEPATESPCSTTPRRVPPLGGARFDLPAPLDRKPYGFLFWSAWTSCSRRWRTRLDGRCSTSCSRQDGQSLVALYVDVRHDPRRDREAPRPARRGRARRHQASRAGRSCHYLNPVPIRLVHDRWVSKYTEAWTAGLVGLKKELETHHGEGLRDLHPHHPRAAVGGDHRPRHPAPFPLRQPGRVGLDAGVAATSSPTRRSDGPLIEGENLEVDPPRRLVQTHERACGARRPPPPARPG